MRTTAPPPRGRRRESRRPSGRGSTGGRVKPGAVGPVGRVLGDELVEVLRQHSPDAPDPDGREAAVEPPADGSTRYPQVLCGLLDGQGSLHVHDDISSASRGVSPRFTSCVEKWGVGQDEPLATFLRQEPPPDHGSRADLVLPVVAGGSASRWPTELPLMSRLRGSTPPPRAGSGEADAVHGGDDEVYVAEALGSTMVPTASGPSEQHPAALDLASGQRDPARLRRLRRLGAWA